MRRYSSVMFALLLMLMATQVFAQSARRKQIELFAGAAFPLAPADFKDYYKIGGSLHGQYVFFPSPTLGISLGAAGETFTFDGNKYLEDAGLTGSGVTVAGSASIVELGVGLRPYLTKPDAGTQFFLFGMGTFNLLHDEATVSGGGVSQNFKEDFNKVGVAVGAGFEIPAGEKLNIIIQGLTRFIFSGTETPQADGSTKKEAVSFVGVTAGLVF